MRTSNPQQTILSLPLANLSPHPDNANRMSKVKFNKLIEHIHTTGQYEPLVVRKHPIKEETWQVLNGHHRLRALKKLRHTHVDCIIFKANDEQAQLYLLNLNRLTGRDNVYKKARLIEQLCQYITPRNLAKQICDSKTSIEKLNYLSKNQSLPKTQQEKPFLLPMTFFMTEKQHQMISAAFEKAGNNSPSSHSNKRLDALCRIAEEFLNK